MTNRCGCSIPALGIIFSLLACGSANEVSAPSVSETLETTVAVSTTCTTTTDILTTQGTTVTTNVSTTTEATTTEATATTDVTTTTKSAPREEYLGVFRGTYYHGDYVPCKGGSGRWLKSCYVSDDEIKGSVACRAVYERYGYSLNGEPTVVRLKCSSHPEINGLYTVDDCCASLSVMDFYFEDYSRCPWQFDGVINVEAWVILNASNL